MEGQHGAGDATTALLDRLVGDPELRAALAEVHDAAMTAVDQRVLALCCDRAATLIGLDAPPLPPNLSPTERACVELVEQMVLDVMGVTDGLVAAVAVHLGADGAATFVTAALVIEQRLRIRALWERLGLGDAA